MLLIRVKSKEVKIMLQYLKIIFTDYSFYISISLDLIDDIIVSRLFRHSPQAMTYLNLSHYDVTMTVVELQQRPKKIFCFKNRKTAGCMTS